MIRSHRRSGASPWHTALVLAVLASRLWVPSAASAADRNGPTAAATSPGDALARWRWPVLPARIVAPFVAPAHAYGPGHRGIDLAASPGDVVAAPASGLIAFAGSVAGRGVVTIDHGDGLVTTLEPVVAGVPVGAPVHAGDQVGTVDAGGHASVGTVHFGVRRDGVYINPMLLLGGIPRAILLPCC